jgi:hypothetical protein
MPLTLPSPARGEDNHVEIVKKFPPPRRGRARVGVRIISKPVFDPVEVASFHRVGPEKRAGRE